VIARFSPKFAIAVLIALNAIRFWGFGISPPGFYIDEAVGAAHVLCLKQTGADYWGVPHPLFSAGPGGGYFTAPYLYGEALWTSIWGDSTAAFRSFAALVTVLAILFLTLYTRKKTDDRTALWVALMATVAPWVFQFSRIAWDPPMVPIFLMLGLYLLEGRSRWSWLFSALAFAGAAYAYPPARVQVPLLLIFLPGVDWKKTAKMIGAFVVLVIPVLLKSFDPAFMARTRMLAITSDYPSNPYRDASIFGWVWAVMKQTFEHLSPQYLAISGDRNLRHSTQAFGMISWVQYAALVWGLGLAFVDGVRVVFRKPILFWSRLTRGEQTLLVLGGVGTFVGIAPAAMTWEGVPHAIRSIGAWPFLCMLSGVVIEHLLKKVEAFAGEKNGRVFSRGIQNAVWAGSLVFFAMYLQVFFGDYARDSVAWFQVDRSPIAQAYGAMTRQGLSCEAIRGR